MKAGIYIRVSTEEQAKEGYSISAQKKKLQAFCQSQDWEVAGFYADEGVSAKNTNRPQLQKMLTDIEMGLIECVLVYRLDRLTRSVFDLYKLLEVFDKHKCSFKSATEVYDTTTAMGRMFITIVAALAQWERENMAERIKFGQTEKVRQRKYTARRPPFGYKIDKDKWQLYIVEEEARIVREIFKLYQSGLGANRLAKSLNSRGIFTREGNKWSPTTVMSVLQNRVHEGHIEWNDDVVEDTHPAIISKEEFAAVQKLTKIRYNTPAKAVASDYIFSSKIRCSKCGASLVGNYTSRKDKKGNVRKCYYYRCRDRATCEKPDSIAEAKIDNAFINYLTHMEINNTLYNEEAIIEQKEEYKDEEKQSLLAELAKLEQRKKRFQLAWADDIMSYDDFKSRMEEAQRREDCILVDLKKFNKEPEEQHPIDKEKIIGYLKEIKENWSYLERKEKKAVVASIVNRMHMRVEGHGKSRKIEIIKVDFI